MATEQVYPKRITRLFQQGTMTGLNDMQFLERFVAEGDATALESHVASVGVLILGGLVHAGLSGDGDDPPQPVAASG